MKWDSPWKWSLLLGGALLALVPANAQQARGIMAKQAKTAAAANRLTYQVSREVSVQGTVVSFTENSSTPPIGAHVVLQTSAGSSLDVVLGDARLLQQNNFTIATGSSIRVIGETLPFGEGSIFVARLVQQGTQVVALRSTNGMPLVFAGNRGKAGAQANTQQGGPR